MPRPNRPRTIQAEAHLRANVLRLLDEQERTTAWLGRKMAEAGCAVDPAAVWKSLHRDRRVVVDEALAMASALGVSLTDLITPEAAQ